MNTRQADRPGKGRKQPLGRRDWTVSRFLRETEGTLRLRAQVREHPLFGSVTLGTLVDEPARLTTLLTECRMIPQCGEVQIKRLFAALGNELAAVGAMDKRPPDPVLPTAPEGQGHAAATLGSPIAGKVYPDMLAALDDVFVRFWRLAQFEPFIYLPGSVPDFVYTAAVLRAELGDRAGIDDYLRKLDAIRVSTRSVAARGLIVLDGHTLDTIFARQGRYAALTDADVAEQRAALHRMLSELPAGVDCVVTDYDRQQLSSGFIVGEDHVLYNMGCYMVFRNSPILGLIRGRCLALNRRDLALSRFLAAGN
ncbi:MAG: hypothetical protein JJU42_07155 [Rhodobacteraceae bacterium]|nr:hypothetical protein [Paracoccaceae bacterium]